MPIYLPMIVLLYRTLLQLAANKMNIKRLKVATVTTAIVISLSLCACGNDTARTARYKNPDSIEYKDWSVKEERQIIDSISQTYNKEIRLRNKIISNQLERFDSDIESMNDRYSYGQNITGRRLRRH